MLGAQSVTEKLQFDTLLPSWPPVYGSLATAAGGNAMAAKRVLLVEDEPEIGDMLSFALQSVGYAVDVAGTATQARAQLDGLPYTLVIADWRLPDGDAVETANRAA